MSSGSAWMSSPSSLSHTVRWPLNCRSSRTSSSIRDSSAASCIRGPWHSEIGPAKNSLKPGFPALVDTVDLAVGRQAHGQLGHHRMGAVVAVDRIGMFVASVDASLHVRFGVSIEYGLARRLVRDRARVEPAAA